MVAFTDVRSKILRLRLLRILRSG